MYRFAVYPVEERYASGWRSVAHRVSLIVILSVLCAGTFSGVWNAVRDMPRKSPIARLIAVGPVSLLGAAEVIETIQSTELRWF